MKKILILFLLLSTHLLNAAELNLDQYKGSVVYLDFWASWCGPCKESFPWMNELQKKYPNLKIVAVNLDKKKSDADLFLKENPAKFEVLFDPTNSLAEKYKIRGMPYSIVLDVNGKEKFSHIGFSKKKSEQYIEEIKSLLGNK